MIMQKEGKRLTESKTMMKLPREIESGRKKSNRMCLDLRSMEVRDKFEKHEEKPELFWSF